MRTARGRWGCRRRRRRTRSGTAPARAAGPGGVAGGGTWSVHRLADTSANPRRSVLQLAGVPAVQETVAEGAHQLEARGVRGGEDPVVDPVVEQELHRFV